MWILSRSFSLAPAGLLSLCSLFGTAPLAAGAPEPSPAFLAAPAGLWESLQLALGADNPWGVGLRSVVLAGNRLTLDFSRELRELGLGTLACEQFVRRVHLAAGDLLNSRGLELEIFTQIEGIPLHHLLAGRAHGEAEVPVVAVPAVAVHPLGSASRAQVLLTPESPGAAPATQAWLPRRIALSPGHGYYLNGANAWVLQRGYWQGIVEDFVNHDMITLLAAELRGAGAEVFPTRQLDRAAGNGESGFPQWQEAARYYVKALGADAAVWNEPNLNHLDQDIRSRPRYANAINAEILVSLHNNGGGGTGTETLYDTANGFGAESKRLAEAVHNRVIAAIRRDYLSTWPDRLVKGFNGDYGENRLATRPAIIIEVAFMDRPVPDNAALQDNGFKRIVAQAIREGIELYFSGPGVVPAPPGGLRATAAGGGIALGWTDQANNETGFRVERRAVAATVWETLGTVGPDVTAYLDTSVAPGTVYVYRAAAFNTLGASALFSNEATAAPRPTPLFISSILSSDTTSLDWDQDVTVTVAVTDQAGRAVSGGSLSGYDPLVNTAIAAPPGAANGQIVYRSRVPPGTANGAYRFNFSVSKPGYVASPVVSCEVEISHVFPSAVRPPVILLQPVAQRAVVAGRATFKVEAAGAGPLTYQWRLDGRDLAGATEASYVVADAAPARAGLYAVVMANGAGATTSLAVPLTVTPAAWLANLSLRTNLGLNKVVTVGFFVAGGSRDLLLRSAGPTLAQFGISAVHTDPRLELYRGLVKINQNNDWPAELGPVMAALGAFPLLPAGRDAALLVPIDGAHTLQVSGPSSGALLIEGYDQGGGGPGRLVNLSARHRVGIGPDILIAGFYVAGTGTCDVLIRAIGPALVALGVTDVLADPKLEIYDSAGVKIAENDNWAPTLAPTFAAVAAFPLPAGSRDAALALVLPAGRSYTAQISGIANATGEALVEVYEVP